MGNKKEQEGCPRLFSRRSLLKGGLALGAVTAVEMLSPVAIADGPERFDPFTYKDFLSLFPDPNNPQNTLKNLSETIIVKLDRDLKMEKFPIQVPSFVGSQIPLAVYAFSEQKTGGNLVFIFAPADDGTMIFSKDDTIKFENIPVSDEVAIDLAKRTALPLIFKGLTNQFPTPDCDQRYQYCPTTPVQDASAAA